MKTIYSFVNGQIAITVQYWVEEYEEVDAGARIDVRRAELYEGSHHREGAEGHRVLPVGDGGIWRIDLSHRIDCDVPVQRFHHHPDFQDGDVGPRAFDPELSAHPLEWIERRLLDLPAVLTEKGFEDLAQSIDTMQLARSMPLVRTAIEASLEP
ncbi:hypothetical protein ACFV2V_30500 [Streptomyces sp. NPDC059698]|uniref:hypothetical protein n=1 Tax=unclassified Streptomyces TaxID=2593676 RepID=UPI000938CFC3|nr:hypothetical protein [Streptomyces sp. CB02366]OKJ28020.1 hypothetical protein AMK24_30505 [Streptomyces sp. CB02366]TVP35679.1 hypothetical protein A3L22_30230 [Streptomyces griseus subsp. griseus]WSS58886.1 hypothetical protein OG543_27590 [Streptomyces sp. NBC_01178]